MAARASCVQHQLIVMAISFLLLCRESWTFPLEKNWNSPRQRAEVQTTGFATVPKTKLYSSNGTLGPKQKKKNLKSFVRYLEIECWRRAELRELEPVLQAVADACKLINRIVQRAQTDDLYGVALDKNGNPLDDTNIQGEVQQQLDVLCNTIMLRAFCGCSSAIHSVASEEEDEARCCSDVMVRRFF
jgi:hypothetical protein